VPRKPSAATLVAREKEVKGLLLQINEEVDKLPIASLRRLAPALRVARAELERDLTAWLSKLDGRERFTAQHLRVALLQVREAVKAIEKVSPEMKSALRAGASRAAVLANTHLQREAAFFSVRFGDSLQSIPILEAGKVIDKTLLDGFDASRARWTKNARAEIRKRLAISLVKRETVEQMQRRLVGRHAKYLSPLATQEQKARVVSRVLWSKVESDARRIVRTEVINAYNSTKLDMIDELNETDPGWGKRWDAALDARTCPACRALDHMVVKADEKFPGNVAAPPLHPNCRCAVIAWRNEWEPKGSKIRFKGSYSPPEGGKRPTRSPRTKA
jgi:SPP1 gp7 family putative phage head morphogenesis protein